jgi:hypothetical protein
LFFPRSRWLLPPTACRASLAALDITWFFREHDAMAGTIPADAVLVLERHLGSEDALVVVRGLEEAVQRATEVSWARTRDELLVAMRREFVTRELFEERMGALRAELLGKTEADKAELLGKLQAVYEKTEKDKAELLGKIEALYEKTEKDKAELQGLIRATREELLGKIQSTREDLVGRIEALRLAMDRKITLWSLVILFAVVLINRDALEFVARLLGIVK